MYAIVKFSTDMRSRNYRIEFTQSRSKAEAHCGIKSQYSHKDPEAERNFHKDLCEVYEMPYGWRRPSKKAIEEEVYNRRGSIYSPNSAGILYKHVSRDGLRLGD